MGVSDPPTRRGGARNQRRSRRRGRPSAAPAAAAPGPTVQAGGDDADGTSSLPDGSLAARVGACAVGLAYAGHSGDQPVGYLLGLADARFSELAEARQRIQTLNGIEQDVLTQAAALLDAAMARWAHQADAAQPPATEPRDHPTVMNVATQQVRR